MATRIEGSKCRISGVTAKLVRTGIGLALAAFAAGAAYGQTYPGGGGTGGGTGTGGSSGGTYTPPKGGYSSTGRNVGIGVGAGAGIGILAYALHHHHKVMTACVQPADEGMRIVDEKKNVSYLLQASDVSLKAGERVEVQGKKAKNDSGADTFAATKLVKDLGSCGAAPSPTTTAQAQTTGH